MLILVQIDTSSADFDLFEKYENKVLGLLGKYGARVEERLRASDRQSETHLLYFPNSESLASFRDDPTRAALQDTWHQCRATSILTEVIRLK